MLYQIQRYTCKSSLFNINKLYIDSSNTDLGDHLLYRLFLLWPMTLVKYLNILYEEIFWSNVKIFHGCLHWLVVSVSSFDIRTKYSFIYHCVHGSFEQSSVLIRLDIRSKQCQNCAEYRYDTQDIIWLNVGVRQCNFDRVLQ